MQQNILIPLPADINFLEAKWRKYTNASFWYYFPYILMTKKPGYDIGVYWDTISNDFPNISNDEEFMNLCSDVAVWMESWILHIPYYSFLFLVDVVDVKLTDLGLILLVERDEYVNEQLRDGLKPCMFREGSIGYSHVT